MLNFCSSDHVRRCSHAILPLACHACPDYHLLGLAQEHAVGVRVARREDDLAVLTAIWQTPGPLALDLMLNLTAQAATPICLTLPPAPPPSTMA